jgi:hypothetical protein
MKRDSAWWLRIAVAVLAAAALGVALFGVGMIAGPSGRGPDDPGRQIGADGISLVAFDSCDSALDELREALLPQVGPYGLAGASRLATEGAGSPQAPAAGGPAAPGRSERDTGATTGDPQQHAPGHSKTNTHESGVDEPDLVKTDGRRLVTIVDGTLRVVDVTSRAQTATLEIPGGPATQLLLDGDRALVMTASEHAAARRQPVLPGSAETGYGTQLVLVDLSGGATVRATLAVEGDYVDARQVGSVARVVVRSVPHLGFVYPDGVRSDREALARNRAIVNESSISDWLPRFELARDGRRQSGQLVDCAAVSRPASYTGAAMLTVLTIDLTNELTSGDPVSIVADGNTVYGTGSSLYVADDHIAHGVGGIAPTPPPSPRPATQRTEVYQFDISKPGKPVYVASGGVAGALLNQYSLSEHAGHLRIATTMGDLSGRQRPAASESESAVTVLARKDDTLMPVGRIGGLGIGERIYAVRFYGPVAFVVTFRQTDPLYTMDLSDPVRPKVAGELKITGYSAYLHAAGPGRLIGVGQEATEQGRRTGTQVSLFDTSHLSAPRRIAQYQLPGGNSEAEADPHAFLYWPEKGLVVIPVSSLTAREPNRETAPGANGALVLRLAGESITEVGRIAHPVDQYRHPDGSVRRTLVIGTELWTVSSAGVMVNDVDRLTQIAWLPFR